nr:MAG TPA: hypothetical protein [Caudoviricetes sp.]
MRVSLIDFFVSLSILSNIFKVFLLSVEFNSTICILSLS